MLDPDVIYTRGDGTPIERPIPPAPDAPPQAFTAWLRADHAYRDEVAAVASRAFDKSFRKAVRAKR